MDTLILLIGESGCGKTTISEELKKKYNFNVLNSYTTRERRTPKERGHIFITKSRLYEKYGTRNDNIILQKLNKDNNVLAETYYCDNFYFTTKDQYKNKGISIYVIDPYGAEHIKLNNKDNNIISIYLKSDRKIRYNRLYLRYRQSMHNVTSNKATDMATKRINRDKKSFGIISKVDYVIDVNDSLENSIKNIEYILSINNFKEIC